MIVIDYTARDLEGNEWTTHEVVPFETYPSGELRVNIKPRHGVERIRVRANFTAKNLGWMQMQLVFVMDILCHQYVGVRKTLEIPYMPYSRQDRRCADGDSDQLQIFLDMIDGYFEEVVTYDMHNPKSLQEKWVSTKYTNIPQLSLIQSWPVVDARIRGVDVVVAPDKGAIEKSGNVAHHYGLPLSFAQKVRNPENGEILKTVVADGPEVFRDKQVLICDDICDGGRTFIEIAKVLKEHGAKRVILYATHGIMSKGCQVVTEWIDEVYIYNYIGQGPLGPNVWARGKD